MTKPAPVMAKIPARTRRLHLDPYWLGDSPKAIRTAARRRQPIDQNEQRCADGVVGIHWPTAAEGGWRYIRQPSGKRRPMTHDELHRPIHLWTTAGVESWRRTPKWGRAYEARVRPHSFAEQVRCAKRWHVTLCAELKSRSFADETIAATMYAVVTRQRATVYVMTLVTMRDWQGKLKAFHDAGWQTALILGKHGAAKPDDFDQWSQYVDRVWGTFHR